MYDIPELEKKWRKYRRNKIKKPIIIGSVIAVLGLGSASLVMRYIHIHKSSSNKSAATIKPQAQTVSAAVNSNAKNSSAMIIQKVNSNGTPIQNNNQQIQNSPQNQAVNQNNGIDLSKAEIVKPNVPDDDIRVIGFNNKDKKKIKKKYEDILIPKQSEEEIAEKEKVAQMEEDFKETQDTKDSLYLARYFYKKGDYKKAESWAVQTNNIDGDIEESWLIFAKARAKQGFRTDAIKVLQSYYDETKSEKAKELLRKLRLGKSF